MKYENPFSYHLKIITTFTVLFCDRQMEKLRKRDRNMKFNAKARGQQNQFEIFMSAGWKSPYIVNSISYTCTSILVQSCSCVYVWVRPLGREQLGELSCKKFRTKNWNLVKDQIIGLHEGTVPLYVKEIIFHFVTFVTFTI